MADYSAERRRQAVRTGQAMRGGRFPIRNAADMDNAIRAVGRVRPNTEQARAMVRRHIIRRARALGSSKSIPPTWNPDGSLKGYV